MAGLHLSRGLQHVEKAVDIGADVRARRLERIAHAGLRGQVDDDVGGKGADVGQDKVGVLEHAAGEAEPRPPGQKGKPRLFQCGVVVGGHAVEAVDRRAL